MTLEDAVKKLRGKPGSKVHLTIMRSKKKEILEFEMERAVIKIESITAVQMLENQIGYVRISEFQERTAEDLQKGIQTLQAQNLEGLILDLRSNPGGLLQASVEVANLFVKKDSLIVSTKGRKPTQNMTFNAKKDAVFHMPLIILVNGGSASAAEIVAGAIQDLKRGMIVGEKSFGKGSVQSVIPLKDGSALKLTTAKYFTPSGKTIQSVGIQPDIVVELTTDETLNLKKHWRKKHEKENDKDSPVDRQLQTAINLLKGVKIFEESKQAS
jgi:carboxyl-terminal processing protease